MRIVKLYSVILYLCESKLDLGYILLWVYLHIYRGADKGGKYWKHIGKIKCRL